METEVIYVGDCVEIMKQLPDCCVDLVFADPPYGMSPSDGNPLTPLSRPDGTSFHGMSQEWDKFSGSAEYNNFTSLWLTQVHRVLKDDGCLWVIGSHHNIFHIGSCLVHTGWFILNSVIWVKNNPPPQFRGVRFCNSVETIIWCVKSRKAKYHFDYHLAKEMNGGKQMRADWHLPICTGRERIKIDGKKAHPNQKPEEILRRIISITSEKDDIILDPFFGTGTTGAVAQKLGRRWIGVERNENYADVAYNRLSNLKVD